MKPNVEKDATLKSRITLFVSQEEFVKMESQEIGTRIQTWVLNYSSTSMTIWYENIFISVTLNYLFSLFFKKKKKINLCK